MAHDGQAKSSSSVTRLTWSNSLRQLTKPKQLTKLRNQLKRPGLPRLPESLYEISRRVGIVPGNIQQRDSSASSLTLTIHDCSQYFIYSLVLWFASCRSVLWPLLGTSMFRSCPHLTSLYPFSDLRGDLQHESIASFGEKFRFT